VTGELGTVSPDTGRARRSGSWWTARAVGGQAHVSSTPSAPVSWLLRRLPACSPRIHGAARWAKLPSSKLFSQMTPIFTFRSEISPNCLPPRRSHYLFTSILLSDEPVWVRSCEKDHNRVVEVSNGSHVEQDGRLDADDCACRSMSEPERIFSPVAPPTGRRPDRRRKACPFV